MNLSEKFFSFSVFGVFKTPSYYLPDVAFDEVPPSWTVGTTDIPGFETKNPRTEVRKAKPCSVSPQTPQTSEAGLVHHIRGTEHRDKRITNHATNAIQIRNPIRNSKSNPNTKQQREVQPS